MRRARPRVASASADPAGLPHRPGNIGSSVRRGRQHRLASSPAPPAASGIRRSSEQQIDRSSRAAPRPKRSRGVPDQQGHGKGCEQRGRGYFALHAFAGKAIAPGATRQRQSRIAPLSRQRHGEARHDRDEILAAAKRQQPAQMTALRHQRLILGGGGKIFAALAAKRAARGRSSTASAARNPNRPAPRRRRRCGARLQQPRTQRRSPPACDCPDPPGSSPTVRCPDKNPARPARPS